MGMHKHDRLPAIQFLVDGHPNRIPYVSVPVAGEDREAICIQRAESIVDFAHATVDVVQRERDERKNAKTAWVVGSQLGRVIVLDAECLAHGFNVSVQARRYLDAG